MATLLRLEPRRSGPRLEYLVSAAAESGGIGGKYFQCQTTAFDLCSVQLSQNTNTLSILFSGTSNSPDLPAGGGQALLMLTGWSRGEQFSGYFNDAVPEPGPFENMAVGIMAFLVWRRFSSASKRNPQ